MKAIIFIAILAFAGPAKAQNSAVLTIEFDNRGSKVMDKSTNAKIMAALAKDIFMVPPGQVAMAGGLGQSSLINHKSTVTYIATGPTTNGKSVLANCQSAAASKWLGLRSSPLEKSLKKATDTWMPGDSVTVKRASCSAPRAGRKLAM